MKTLELKLKKDVLIVDLPNIDVNSKPKIIQDSFGFWIYFKIKGHKPAKIEIPHTFFDYKNYKNYKFLCKGSEFTEEIASELFEYDDFLNCFEAYIDTVPSIDKSAFKLFIKIFESKGFYWLKNPISLDRAKLYESIGDTFRSNGIKKEWQEAEAKTFKNPLIFVKKYVQ